MSLSGGRRPRVTVNGIQRMRTFHYFWCQNCRRTVRVHSAFSNQILCPYCFHQLRLELDILRRPIADPFGGRVEWVSETENEPVREAWITLQFVEPRPRPIAPTENVTDDVVDSMLNDFIEGMAPPQSDRPGPPPTLASVIERLPRVKLTGMHLDNDPTCPVCKEEFEVGGEARELPCMHFYHSDCIVPWLRMHNTCPVCRYELPWNSYGDDPEDSIDEDFRVDDVANGLNGWWDQLLSLWPFRALSDWTHRHGGKILIHPCLLFLEKMCWVSYV